MVQWLYLEEQVLNSSSDVKIKLQDLILGNKINQYIDEYIVFQDLDIEQNALWSLILMSGYLKAQNTKYEGISRNVDLSVSNHEVLILYKHIIKRWLSKGRDPKWYNDSINNLITENIKEFVEMLQELVINTFSYHDTNRKNGESLYSVLMLGLVAGLHGKYQIKSNRESGHGRFDTILIPNDKTANGIVFEFKVADSEEQLDSTADKALQQIVDNNYTHELQ